MSATPARVSFVLPAYNEVGLLGSTVTNLVTGVEQRGLAYEILIVENGSQDGTLRLARMLSAQLPHVRVLTLPRGNYGAALRAGFMAATGEYVVNFDVDYYDLSFLDAATKLLDEGADVVVASKRAPDARDRRPRIRRVLTFAFTLLLRHVVHLPVTDAHGMKAMRRASLTPVVEATELRGSIYDVEVVCRAATSGLTVRELPATVLERRAPRSSVAIRSLEAIASIVRLWAILRRERRGNR